MNRAWPRDRSSDAPLLLDAAIGTRLIERGLDLGRDLPALWVLSQPDVVLALHRADVAAGSDAILTATFGATRGVLDRYDRGSDFERLQTEAVALARTSAGPDRFVIGSVTRFGPEPVEHTMEQAERLGEAGVDALVLETARPADALAWLAGMRPRFSGPLVVSLADPAADLAVAARKLQAAGADAVGVNCQTNLDQASAEIARLNASGMPLPLWLKPGGGLPGAPAIRPEAFAARTAAWIEQGVRFLGGCCGTSEAHLAAIDPILRRCWDARRGQGR